MYRDTFGEHEMQTVEIDTPYGTIRASWRCENGMIAVTYAGRTRKAEAGSDEGMNEFLALDLLRSLIAEDMKHGRAA